MTVRDHRLYTNPGRSLLCIDAGYVVALMAAHHDVDASKLRWNHAELVDWLTSKAEADLGCPVLRVHWYDAIDPAGRHPNPRAAAMARVAGVKVRAGQLTFNSRGVMMQKAVDTRLVADMIVHATRGLVSDVIVITGDQDMVPGVEEVQNMGGKVILWSIGGADLPQSVSRELINTADAHEPLPGSALAQFILGPDSIATPAPVAPPVEEPTEPTAAPPAAERPAVARPAPVPAPPVKTPGNVPHSPAVPTPPRQPATPAASEFAPLYDLSPTSYFEAIPSGLGFSPSAAPLNAGRVYGQRWWAANTADARNHILHFESADSPHRVIPRDIDTDLLRFAEEVAKQDTWGPVWIKHSIRQGFWDAIDDLAAQEEL